MFISFVLYKSSKEILESLKNVLKAFFHPKIITPMIFMFFYSLGIVFLLNKIGLWENHQIKNFIYWLVAVGILTHFKKDTYSAKGVIKDTISLAVVFQFILTFYTFNLFFELIFILLITILSLTKVVAEKDKEKNSSVIKVIDFILISLGILIIILSINKYINNFSEFADIKTLYDFLVPSILSIMIIPYFYMFFILVRYENAFVSLNFVLKDNKKLRNYAKLKGIIAFNFDVKNFERWSRSLISYDLDKDSIKQSIKNIKKLKEVRKNIHKINLKKGWHPFIANEFLKDDNILINEYTRQYDERWNGYSNYINIYEDNSHMYYRIEGTIEHVDKLQLQLFFYFKDKKNIEKSYNTFVNICNKLSINAINHSLSDEILNALISEENLEIKFYDKTILVKHESFATGAYKLSFTVY
ncbi:hypothetical protein N5915_04180 [Arcobacter lacus]|uniref:hypothetical protein n=1 Tax=Arcobacter lacus TaxID=1912876 RepID=UPI0021BAB6F2|nr:hypothetical protein [Arcobacter lacus]MCT7908749.1 hypothetical protein [Arcobacter lacus]